MSAPRATPKHLDIIEAMASIRVEPDGTHVFSCNNPACLAKRARRGQKNGVYLGAAKFDPQGKGSEIHLKCPDCGTAHDVVFFPLGNWQLKPAGSGVSS